MNARELVQKLRERQQEMQRPKASMGEAMGQNFTEGLTENLLGFPNVMAQIAERQTGYRLPRDSGLLGALPDSGREALSSLRVGGENLLGVNQGPTGQRVANEVARRDQVQRDAPGGGLLGRLGADAFTIAGGRQPFVKGAGGIIDAPVKRGIDRIVKGLGTNKTGVKAFVRDYVDDELVRDIARGTGRAAEAGVEGMFLSALQEGDPAETAALAAGGQLAGSLMLSVGEEVFDAPVKGLKGIGVSATGKASGFYGKAASALIYAAAAGGALTLLDQLTINEDSVLAGDESGYEKLILAGSLGLIAAAAGAGRSQPDGMMKALPKVADAMRTIPRGAIISIMEDATSQDVIRRVMEDPKAFEDYAKDIEDDLKEGKNPFKRLAEEDEKFKEILRLGRLGGVPEK